MKGKEFATSFDAFLAGRRSLEQERDELWEIFAQIIEDLPVGRDWLDPTLERRARAALRKYKPLPAPPVHKGDS